MKKLIFGCALMLCGVIGGTGWLIAYCSLVQGGAWSTVMHVFDRVPECFIIIAFYAVAVFGAVAAVTALKEKK